jgi:hypothetical protein
MLGQRLPFDTGWLRSRPSVRRAFENTSTEITVAAFSNYEEVERGDYLFRRVVTSGDNDTTVYSYTNTSACPAALPPLRRLARLRMPQPEVPIFGREENIVVTDGAHYILRGRVIHADTQVGRYEIESNVGTPLALWVDSMLAALRQCWSPSTLT